MPFDARRFPGRAGLWLCAALAAAPFFSCVTETELPHAYFRLQADSGWLGYDSLRIGLDHGDGSAPNLLFAARLVTLSDLERIPADGYGSGKATVSLRAYRDGRVARAENLAYDLDAQSVLGVTVLVAPATAGTPGDSTVAGSGLVLSMRPGDTLVSIGDTVPLIAAGWNEGGSLLEAAWDLDGDGAPDRVEHPAAASALLRAGARFREPGEYRPSLTLKGSQGGTLRREVRVKVVLDPPAADAGPDIGIGADSELVLIGRGKDSLGRIVKQEWQVGDSPAQNAPDGKLAVRMPSAPGELLAVFRVTDDDGLIAVDTARIRVEGNGPATRTPMPAGVTLNLGAQGAAAYGAVLDIDSQAVWKAVRAFANQREIDLILLYYENAFHLNDAVQSREAGNSETSNFTNSLEPAEIKHVDMARIAAEPADQESALAAFTNAPALIHGSAVAAGDMFLVKSTGGKLAFLKVVSLTGTDKTGGATVLLKVLTL